jgi:hypothetical protein
MGREGSPVAFSGRANPQQNAASHPDICNRGTI